MTPMSTETPLITRTPIISLFRRVIEMMSAEDYLMLMPCAQQGHYRFCDALFMLGEHQRAVMANERAQELCYKDADGVRDLLQQNIRFKMEMEPSRGRM
ncbi:hypothetical protein Z043_107661 [Scleropages formosus]|uniref:Uncharacterized protein n=1 Tax=Scleropages formosus TaxID=113540 RepID=A0A0P7UTT4_SCLFO|nr:hypothetical protein Z043_107661 [Scleropages formosus]